MHKYSSVRVRINLLQLYPTLYNPMDCGPPGSSVHGDSAGKNSGVGCHALLQGIFPTQGSNPHLCCFLHWQVGATWEAPSRSRASLKDDQKRERLGQFPSEAQWSVGPYPQMGCKIHLCVAISIFSRFSPEGLTLRTKHAGMSRQTESQAKLSAHNRKHRGNSCPWEGKG